MLREPSNFAVEETKFQISKVVFRRIVLTNLGLKPRSSGGRVQCPTTQMNKLSLTMWEVSSIMYKCYWLRYF